MLIRLTVVALLLVAIPVILGFRPSTASFSAVTDPVVRFVSEVAGGDGEADGDLAAALLAIEEAELRERMMTALAVAEGWRLRGRTVLVAQSELTRVRRALGDLSPTDPKRTALENRIAALEARQREVSAVLEREFQSYVEIVADLAVDLRPRLRRIAGDLSTSLAERRLDRLADLLPLLQRHVEEMNREGGIGAGTLERWRAEIDDTYERRQRREENPLGEVPVVPEADTDEDI